MNKKIQVIATTLIIALLCFSIGYFANPLYQHFNPKVNVHLQVRRNSVVIGETTGAYDMFSGNLITDIGETFIGESAILGTDANGTWAISLSNDGSPAAGWTELTTEIAANGFTRAAATESAAWQNSGDWAINYTYTFTATGTQQLQTAGLQWDDTPSSNNNLFAAADFTQTTFETDDTLTVLWIITVNANKGYCYAPKKVSFRFLNRFFSK